MFFSVFQKINMSIMQCVIRSLRISYLILFHFAFLLFLNLNSFNISFRTFLNLLLTIYKINKNNDDIPTAILSFTIKSKMKLFNLKKFILLNININNNILINVP